DGDVPGAGPPPDDPRHAAVLLRPAHAAARPLREGGRPRVPVAGPRAGGPRPGAPPPPPPGRGRRGPPARSRTPRAVGGAPAPAGTPPADWTFVDPGSPANYTGWWGTLFPPGTAQRLGLPAPLFLKWDDAEYGLRATQHGFDHAVLPGTSVHHPPWTAFRTQMT